ncbi:conserved hypothetical protein [Leishmania major strain Friedlin]|uniref:Stress-response A/B barrel domain-containing protein n=1 Tax=Leishmania major TaxID=5664 RepID=E9AD52_LEIMA|nr:conserved hypothetical protein [Leishmania major strain Friedlin]CAG9576676.1 Stress_responsive_A/B_Barrel_Domain_-_putative [Leishmania major strain Friedlin]CBZ12136.1 conserved hypothetical protein [Leishmania major strain Friedlin]|eukprot:XP_003721881.1 conserved hypothetical protein [Leishmania major strain Friedlin]
MELNSSKAKERAHHKSLNPQVNSVCHCAHLRLKGPLHVEKLRELLKRVRTTVPGLIELHFGESMNVSASSADSAEGNTHALFSRHQNGQYLKMYKTHPAHMDLMNYLMSRAERPATVVDFVNVASSL